MLKRLRWFGLILVSIIFTLPPYYELAAQGTQTTYREGLVGTIQRLNPLLADLNPVDADITALIFEGLTRINNYGEVEPALAQSWVTSSNGLEYVFTLRQDILWQDGIPFNADDVVYTMSLLSDPDFPGSHALNTFWRTVETQKIDDYRVRFRLAQPLGAFPEALRIGILPYHALQGTTAAQLAAHPINLTPIGTGPYQLEALRTEDGAIKIADLRVAPVYRQRPEGSSGFAVEHVRFVLYSGYEAAVTGLKSNEIDGYAARTRNERPALLNLGGDFTTYTALEPTVGTLIYNWTNEEFPVFTDQRIRQALARGLDRSSLIERHLLNTAVPAESPFMPLSWAYDYDGVDIAWPTYNFNVAVDLLNSANFRALDIDPEGGGPLFSFSIMTLNDPALVSMAQEIATQWSLLNIEVDIEAVNAQDFETRLDAAQFDAAIVELSQEGSADPDLYDFWHQGQYPDGQNFGGVNDTVISETLERARGETNGTNRFIYYRTFQQEFINKAIAIPLYYPLFTYAMRTSVSGVQLGFISSPADRFATLQEWQIN